MMPNDETSPLLDISELTVSYQGGGKAMDAVRDFSVRIYPGQTYGLVGESGSGKTTIALAIMGYLGAGGIARKGKILFDGEDLLAMSKEELRTIWGRQISLVPQDPLSSLNPSMRIREQLGELLRLHLGMNQVETTVRVVELLEMVRLPDPERVARSYPHQLSGGMQQRVMIAMALSTQPKLLVLDEPTTNLDVTTQATVLDLLRDLIRDHNTTALYVTHNLGVVARICDRVATLYAGELVEDVLTSRLYHRPFHPYTQGLIQSVPRLGQRKQFGRLRGIPGQIPSIEDRPPACVFVERCDWSAEICHQVRPGLEQTDDGRRIRCHRWQEIQEAGKDATQDDDTVHGGAAATDRSPILKLDEIEVHFDVTRTVKEVLTGKAGAKIKAVDGISLALPAGQTVGLVGESGSGKTTLARAIIGLEESTGGTMRLLELALPRRLGQRNRETIRQLQYVFQNPEDALNPYLSIGESLRRPFIRLLGKSRREADKEVLKLLERVRLSPAHVFRLPHQLSGGEKQRVAIARAVATNPDLLIADEAVSALDVSVQASILNLLNEIQNEHGNAMLFISHDLSVVAYLADCVAVVYVGRLMEFGNADDLFTPPHHPYTEALLSAVPLTDPDVAQRQIRLEGDVPSQMALPTGCPFHPRCPRFLGEICKSQSPPWQLLDNGKRIFCHIPADQLRNEQAEMRSAGGGA